MLQNVLRFHGIGQDGFGRFEISHQFDVAERGFSTRFDAELMARMNQKGYSVRITAKTTDTMNKDITKVVDYW